MPSRASKTSGRVKSTKPTDRPAQDFPLGEGEAALQALMEVVTHATVILGLDRRILACNQAVAQRLGRSREELLGRDILETTPPELRASRRDYFNQALASPEGVSFEEKRSGLVLLNSMRPILDNHGQVKAVAVFSEDITERRKAEELLKASEAKYRLLFESSLEAVILASPGGQILDANPEACRIFGYTVEQFKRIGREGLLDQDDPRKQPALAERDRRGVFEGELRFRRADGSIFTAEISSRLFQDMDGQTKVNVAIRDISQRKEVERALRRSEELHRAMMNAITQPVLLVDLEGMVLAINENGAARLGKTPQEMAGRSLNEVLPPELFRARLAKIAEMARLKQPVTFDDRHGERQYVNNLYPVFDDEGEVRAAAVFGDDVSERRQAQKALQESEELYRQLFNNSLDGFFITTPEGSILAANPAGCRMFGYSQDELKSLGRAGIMDHSDPRLAELLRRREQDGFARGELTGIRKDGSQFPVEVSSQLFLGPAGQRMTSMVNRDLTEAKQAQEALSRSEERLGRALQGADLGLWDWHVQTGKVYFDERWITMLGYKPQEIDPDVSSWENLLHSDDKPAVQQLLQDHFEGRTAIYEAEFRLLCQDGQWKWILARGQVAERDQEGRPLRMVGTHLDVSARKRAEAQLRLAFKAFENTIEGVLVTDAEGKVVMVNPAFSAITGFNAEEVLGKEPAIFRSGQFEPELYEKIWEDLTVKGQWSGELMNLRKDGRAYPEWVTVSIVKDDRGRVTNYLAVFYDVTEIRSGEEKIRYQAFHDPLTGLPNRLLFNDRLDLALARAVRHGDTLAVVFLDLDHFKHINDSLGHAFGDLLLQSVAARLRGLLREEDTVARLGGDEFIMLIPSMRGPEEAAVVAQRIQTALGRPFHLRGREIFVTASLGLTLFPHDGADLETLVKNADLAMYRAKEEGRNTFQMFTPLLNAKAQERLRTEGLMRKALERGEFQVFYQPVVDMATGQVAGMEALARWRRRGRVITPNNFIPLAEETGLIVPLGQQILEQACRQCAQWIEQGQRRLTVAVNLSARQFQQKDLLDMIQAALASSGLPPENLELEITESTVMANVDQAAQTLRRIYAMGVKLALDDFGTGYSSLYYLKQFPIGKLKIDRSFIADIPHDPDDMAISQAVISMARSLGLFVVAEGVENLTQFKYLRALGCDFLQGYLFSPPLNALHMAELLNQGRTLEAARETAAG